MGALKQQGVRVEGCLNQLSVRINSLKGVTSGLQAQLSRLSSGKPFVIMTAGADVASAQAEGAPHGAQAAAAAPI